MPTPKPQPPTGTGTPKPQDGTQPPASPPPAPVDRAAVMEPVVPHGAPVEPVEDEGNPANREAAKYRRQLRDSETQVTALEGKIDALTRAAVEDAAGRVLKDGASIWGAGATPDQFIGEDGRVDVRAVETAAQALAGQFSARQPVGHVASMGKGSGEEPEGGEVFALAFKPKPR